MVSSVGFCLTYLVHSRLYDVRQLEEGSLHVFRVVEMWCQHVLGGPYVDKYVDALLVFDFYYHSNATRVYLKEHKVKYIGAINPNRLNGQKGARLATVLELLISQRAKLLCSTMPRPSMDRKKPRLGTL